MKFSVLFFLFAITAQDAYALEPSCALMLDFQKAPILEKALQEKNNPFTKWRASRALKTIEPENFSMQSTRADVVEATNKIYSTVVEGLWPDDQVQVRANLWIERQVFAQGVYETLRSVPLRDPTLKDKIFDNLNKFLRRPFMNVLASLIGIKRLSDIEASSSLINEVIRDGYEKHQEEILRNYRSRGQSFKEYFKASLRLALLTVKLTVITTSGVHEYFHLQQVNKGDQVEIQNYDNEIKQDKELIEQLKMKSNPP